MMESTQSAIRSIDSANRVLCGQRDPVHATIAKRDHVTPTRRDNVTCDKARHTGLGPIVGSSRVISEQSARAHITSKSQQCYRMGKNLQYH